MVLTLKLLCAAEHAYDIRPNGAVGPGLAGADAPGSAHIGWLDGGPEGAAGGVGNLDAGLVGRIPEGVVVALRGTYTPREDGRLPDVRDWLNDVNIPLGARDQFDTGQVHGGFHRSVMSLWPTLQGHIKAAVAKADEVMGRPAPIFVTGHSKGGAMAPLVAWLLHDPATPREIVVRTFAAPNVGDRTFAEAYRTRVTEHVRFEFAADAIPNAPLQDSLIQRLGPLAAWLLDGLTPGNDGYFPLGTLSYIKTDRSIVESCAEGVRGTDLAKAFLFGGGHLALRDGHLLTTRPGYLNAAYPRCRWTI